MRDRFVVLGNPENRRVLQFSHAYQSLRPYGLEVVSWREFIRNPDLLRQRLDPGCSLRIESPGEDFEVERALLALGAQAAEQEPWPFLSRAEVEALQFDHGRILPLRQWYVGWRALLSTLEEILRSAPGVRWMNSPQEIAAMFDKARCHEIFAAASVPTPAFLGVPHSFEELMSWMEARRCHRVFLKPCHSSSASGVLALERGARGCQAHTSVQMVREEAGVRLFNSLRLQRYTSLGEIRELVDRICQQRSVAEAWFPKAGFDGRRFDLRVVVIQGKAAHTVVRQSAGPITNLHLGNRRGDLQRLRIAMGEERWSAALEVCERATACFPRSLHVGVDLLVAPGFRRFAVAEVNAFGDLLPNLLHGGEDTYTAELRAFLAE